MIGIFVLIFSLCFYKFYGTNDLFMLPFKSGVWGTFSDWLMVIVTGITAVYLIKTFDEQKAANDLSGKIYMNSIRPYFTIELDAEEGQGYIKLTAKNNTIRNFTITNCDTNFIHNQIIPQTSDKVAKENNVFMPIVDRPRNRLVFAPMPIVKLCYSDEEKNYYFQQVYFQSGPDWTISDPEHFLPE
mgnify:CR=1 FL=1